MYEVHSVGTVWATFLYEVLWNLIDKYGFNADSKPTFDSDGVPTDGRYLTMKLVVDGMALYVEHHYYFPHSLTLPALPSPSPTKQME